MRKFILIALMLVIVLTIVGCGNGATNNGTEAPTGTEAPAGNETATGNEAPIEPAGLSPLEMTNVITTEWSNSGKQFAMTGVADRPQRDCAVCHDGFAFANKADIDFAAQWNPGGADEDMDTFPEHIVGIDCQACHTGVGVAYMESGIVDLPYATIDNAGTGAACMFCHSGRRDTPAVFAEYAAGEATRFSYPHYGPAAVFTGKGGMEYPDMEYNSTTLHANLEDSCVSCHMPETGDGYRDHSFTMNLDYIDVACGACHVGIEDYNLNGFVDEIQAMLDTLKEAIFAETGAVDLYSAAGQLVFEGPDGERLSTEDVSLEAFVAGYSYYEVKYEGSYGIHNPAYARSLLQNSYKALTGEDM